MELYIYATEDRKHVATVVGPDNEACEQVAEREYGTDDYASTYSPAFGFVDGLTWNPQAITIHADSEE